jgi:hypothetical protein
MNAMTKALNDFLKQYSGKKVWFILPSGIISGSLALEDKSNETVTLSDVFLKIASVPFKLPGTAAVLCSQITAWGDGSLVGY